MAPGRDRTARDSCVASSSSGYLIRGARNRDTNHPGQHGRPPLSSSQRRIAMSIFRIRPPWKLRLGALLVLVFMATFLMVPLRTAHALSAVSDGTDPYTDGCAGGHASWYVVKSAYIYDDVSQLVGYTQL